MTDDYDSSDEFDDEDDLDLVDEDDDDLDDDDDEGDERDEGDDDLPDEVGAEGNRLVGGLPKGVLEYLARNIVDDPDAVFVETSEGRGEVELRLHVAPGDMGKVIGRRGRVAQALRQVVAAAGSREGVRATLDIVD
ncbi:MAG: KH domain-containing protein [Acidimicrobiia bacterium]